MDLSISIIVRRCTPESTRIYGEPLSTEHLHARSDDLDTSHAVALDHAQRERAEGRSVLVRPNYNETDAQGVRFFREWLSMNGDDFVERRFNF